MRLDKYLSDMGTESRSQIKHAIRRGLVKVNDTCIKRPEFQVSETDLVSFAGNQISYVEKQYYMLYKPAGVVTATADKKEKTVLDLLDHSECRKDLFPVGRLDKDTEGLLLLTNNGDLAHRLLAPKKHVPKTYYVQVNGSLREDMILAFSHGVDIGEKTLTKPAKLHILSCTPEKSEAELTIYEGKFHQIKRMFQTVGRTVLYLKRLSMGTLHLDEALSPGKYRPLTQDEIQHLFQDTM